MIEKEYIGELLDHNYIFNTLNNQQAIIAVTIGGSYAGQVNNNNSDIDLIIGVTDQKYREYHFLCQSAQYHHFHYHNIKYDIIVQSIEFLLMRQYTPDLYGIAFAQYAISILNGDQCLYYCPNMYTVFNFGFKYRLEGFYSYGLDGIKKIRNQEIAQLCGRQKIYYHILRIYFLVQHINQKKSNGEQLNHDELQYIQHYHDTLDINDLNILVPIHINYSINDFDIEQFKKIYNTAMYDVPKIIISDMNL